MVYTKQISGLFTIGDTFCVDFDNIAIPGVRNNGPGIAQNVVVEITVPAGLELIVDGSTVSKGVVNYVNKIWSMGSLIKNESATGSFCFEVTDDCVLPFLIKFELTSDACDCTFNNNVVDVVASGVSCCGVNACRPYLVYKALLTQTGTDAPIATIVDNTLGAPIVWEYSALGVHTGTLAGAFTTNKTLITLNNNSVDAVRTSEDVITLTGLADDLLTESTLIIEVYP